MGAGSGFKTFVTGDVLTAADTNGYLMQGVWVFANAAARTAAVTSPQEGNMSYLKDTNSTEYYSGSAWVAIAPAAAGGWTLESTTALSGSSTSLTIPSGYKQVKIWIENYQLTANAVTSFRLNSISTNTHNNNILRFYSPNSNTGGELGAQFYLSFGQTCTTGNNKNASIITLENYENTTSYKLLTGISNEYGTAGYETSMAMTEFAWLNTSAITSLQLRAGASTWSGGTAYVYGVK
jgi:hypothetical protein